MPFTASGAFRIRERLSERVLKLLEQVSLRLEELVIVTLCHDQCGLIRLLYDLDPVVRWQ
jgi:hypothetical protein